MDQIIRMLNEDNIDAVSVDPLFQKLEDIEDDKKYIEDQFPFGRFLPDGESFFESDVNLESLTIRYLDVKDSLDYGLDIFVVLKVDTEIDEELSVQLSNILINSGIKEPFVEDEIEFEDNIIRYKIYTIYFNSFDQLEQCKVLLNEANVLECELPE